MSTSGEQVVICFSAQRRQGRFLVQVAGVPVWVTKTMLGTLCELAVARLSSPDAYIAQPHVRICRLRTAIGQATGDCMFGERLIETGAGEEYRLASPVRISAAAELAELARCPGLPAGLRPTVQQLCQLLAAD